MSKDDDFFDKYVDSTPKKTTRKGSVKKDLFNETKETTKTDINNQDNLDTDKINEVIEIKEEVKTTKPRTRKKKEPVDIEEKPVKLEESQKDNSTEIESIQEETIIEPKKRTRKTTKKSIVEDSEVVESTETIEIAKDEETTTEIAETETSVEVVNNELETESEEKPSTRTRRKTKTTRDLSLEDYDTNYVTKSLSQTIHESMIPYSEFVILDRALPRVEDGLKPVQRRILYSMLEVGVLPDRPYKKSASIVGECMGKYHPHGDTSIYDTLVRLAQPFNLNIPLVDGHGNFGSVDGDPAAAMRYTEAKLSPLAMELLRDLEKDTVSWSLNFDDRLKEPNMLPGRFPNLLVNGCQGIAVGLATNIPTHNLTEACNAVIAYIDNPNISLDDLMKIMPAPDFPTGAYILDSSEIRQMYEKGKGKIYIRSKINIENADNGKKNIVITEIPYQVNKANMLQKIAKYRDANPNGPLGAILEIVDESDRFGTRAVIKLKKEAKINSILNTLYKYCDVQTTFGASIVAIADGKPKQLSLREILDYYVNFQQKVIYNRTNYDLEAALKKEHILEGLLIAIRNIDEVVRIIKNSKSVTDAKITLMKTFELTDIQAQAILDMRLARLTNLEVNKLVTDLNRLRDLIKRYNAILKSPTLQMKVVKSELQELVKTYGTPRKTKFLSAEEHFEDSSNVLESIENEAEDVETFHFISTPSSTLKTVNLKSYNLVTKELSTNPTLSEIPSISFKMDNNKDVYLFTNIGNCVKLAIKDIPECKFRDKGASLFSLVKNIDKDENIIGALDIESQKDANIIFVTKKGMIKISKAEEYLSSKHLISGIKLGKDDELIMVDFCNTNKKLTLFTSLGNAVKVDISDVAVSGRVSVGVKGIALDKQDFVISASQTTISDAFAIFMSDGSAKIVKQAEIEESARNRKGLNFVAAKTKNTTIVLVDRLSTKTNYAVETTNDKLHFVIGNSLPVLNRLSPGKAVVKEKVKSVYRFVTSK